MHQQRFEGRIAVLIPCLNEAQTVGQVVSDCRKVLPEAEIYVYDNKSTDNTAEQAIASGAIVRYESAPGKGNVIRRMFADVEADIYVLIDGDGSHESQALRRMVTRLLVDRLDMVIGARRSAIGDQTIYRRGHRSGNVFLTSVVKLLFGSSEFSDMLSGYRSFSRRFVKSFPAISTGFEIETELTIHALELKMRLGEEPTIVVARAAGTTSKLKTFADGWRILGTAVFLFKEIRPFLFFSIICLLLVSLAIILAIPIIETFLRTSLVPRFPTAFLAASIMILAFLSFTCGLVLDSVARGRREAKRMVYLSYPVLECDRA